MGLEKQKVEHVVVDTNTFIKNAALQDVAVNIYAVQDVLDEITSKRQLRNLVVLPYNIIVKDVFTENVKFVTEFSKKTGDYISLSATDIKVIALTYQLEKEIVGCDHLKKEPQSSCVINPVTKVPDDCVKIPGFYVPKKSSHKSLNESEDCTVSTGNECVKGDSEEGTMVALPGMEVGTNICGQIDRKDSSAMLQEPVLNTDTEKSNVNSVSSEIDKTLTDGNGKTKSPFAAETETFAKLSDNQGIYEGSSCELLNDVNEVFDSWRDCDDDSYDDEEEEEDDEADWITPENIEEMKKSAGTDDLESKSISVACITSDFAMQNVLKQIGLNAIAIDGRLIRQMRTFVLRCYSCFKRTSIMTKVFCPHCGNRTLKKVAVSVREDGTQEIHINTRRPLSGKGKRFSIPRLRGGKHSNDPILCEDQPIPHQRPSRLACKKNDPLDPDYIAGYSPFVMRDITSKSAMLGIRSGNMKNHFRSSEVNKPKRRK